MRSGVESEGERLRSWARVRQGVRGAPVALLGREALLGNGAELVVWPPGKEGLGRRSETGADRDMCKLGVIAGRAGRMGRGWRGAAGMEKLQK